jgi:hypothetical protein
MLSGPAMGYWVGVYSNHHSRMGRNARHLFDRYIRMPLDYRGRDLDDFRLSDFAVVAAI